MAVTSNMGLPIDQVSITPGPSWATDLEQTKLLIDVHTHVSGLGVPVPTAGLNINSSIPMGGFGLSSAGLMGLSNQLTTSSGQVNFLYAFGGNLYWNQGSGVPIQLTTTTGINVSGVGGISGLTGTTGAWTYSAALTTFIGTADTNKSAAIDVGAVTIRETNVLNANGVKFASPTSLSAGYTITLPSGTMIGSGLMAYRPGTGANPVLEYSPQRAFYVTRTNAFVPGQIARGATATFFGDTTVKDTTGSYNQQQGIYTCPVDGDYFFTWAFGAQVTTGSGGWLQSGLVINSSSNVKQANSVMWVGNRGAEVTLPGSHLYMNARSGDRVKMVLIWDENVLHSSAAAASISPTSGINFFAGYQIK